MTSELGWRRVVALAGGVGGARLVDGLARVLPADALTVIVNTGDDFSHWGLRICPDLDTIMYTLSGLSPVKRGWGIADDTFSVLDQIRRLDGEAWFELGDRDLATHLSRTSMLTGGATLTDVTRKLCARLGVGTSLLPMCNDHVGTRIITSKGATLDFQRWLVQHRGVPEVARVEFTHKPNPTEEVLNALQEAELVVVCPSNPYVSIDPILRCAGVSQLVADTPTVAVSPIIAGAAVKGPLAEMLRSIGSTEPSAKAVAAHYGSLLNGFAVALGDAYSSPVPLLETNILVPKADDRVGLATSLLSFARELR